MKNFIAGRYPCLLDQFSLGKLAICHNLQKMWLYIHWKIAWIESKGDGTIASGWAWKLH